MWGGSQEHPYSGSWEGQFTESSLPINHRGRRNIEVSLMESPSKSGSLDLAFQQVATQPPLGYLQRWGAHYHNSEGSGHGTGHEL